MSLEACGPNGFNISGRRNATCRWKPADRTDSIFQGVATRHVAGSLRTERIQYFRASQRDMSLEACGPKGLNISGRGKRTCRSDATYLKEQCFKLPRHDIA